MMSASVSAPSVSESESPQAEAPPPRALRAHIKTHLTLGSCSTRAVLHDLDAAHSGRLRRGRCACPPPPLASRAHRGLWPLRRPLARYASAARAFISPPPSSRRGEALWERVEAGSGSLGAASSESAAGSAGAVGSGPAAVESAAVSAVAWYLCGCVVGFGWL